MEWQMAQLHPTTGMPVEAPVPRKRNDPRIEKKSQVYFKESILLILKLFHEKIGQKTKIARFVVEKIGVAIASDHLVQRSLVPLDHGRILQLIDELSHHQMEMKITFLDGKVSDVQ